METPSHNTLSRQHFLTRSAQRPACPLKPISHSPRGEPGIG